MSWINAGSAYIELQGKDAGASAMLKNINKNLKDTAEKFGKFTGTTKTLWGLKEKLSLLNQELDKTNIWTKEFKALQKEIVKTEKAIWNAGGWFKTFTGNLKIMWTAIWGFLAWVSIVWAVKQIDKDLRTLTNSVWATEEEAKKLKKSYSDLNISWYINNAENVKSLALIKKELWLIWDEATETSKDVQVMSETFWKDVNETLRATVKLTQNFWLEAGKSNDILTRALQVSWDQYWDILNSVNEYSLKWASAWLSWEEAINKMIVATQLWLRNTDEFADLLRESSIRVLDNSKKTRNAFTSIWLDYDSYLWKIKSWEQTTSDVMQIVAQKILSIKDPILQNQAAVELLGTKYEDNWLKMVEALASTQNVLWDTTNATAKLREEYENWLNHQLNKFTWYLTALWVLVLPWVAKGVSIVNTVIWGLLIPVKALVGFITKLYQESEIFRAALVWIGWALVVSVIPAIYATSTAFLGSMVPAIWAMILKMKALTLAMLSNPITLIITWIAIAVAGLYYTWNNNFWGIQEKTKELFWYLKTWFTEIKDFLYWVWVTIKDFFIENLLKIWNNFKWIFDGIITYMKWFLQIFTWNFREWFSNIIKWAVTFFKNLFQLAKNTFTIIAKILWAFAKVFWTAFIHMFKIWWAFLKDLFAGWKTILTNILIMFETFVTNIIENFKSIDWGAGWNRLIELWSQALTNILNKVKEWWKSVLNYIKNIFSWNDSEVNISTNIKKVSEWEKKSFLKDLWDWIDKVEFKNTRAAVSALWDDISGALSKFSSSGITEGTEKMTKAIKQLWKTKINEDNKKAQQLAEQIKAKQDEIDFLKSQLEKKWGAGNWWSKWVSDKIKQLEEESKKLEEKAKEDSKNIINSYQEVTKKLQDSVKNITKYANKVWELKEKFIKLKEEALKNVNEINDKLSELTEKIQGIKDEGEKERTEIISNSEIELADRRIALLENERDLEKEIADIKKENRWLFNTANRASTRENWEETYGNIGSGDMGWYTGDDVVELIEKLKQQKSIQEELKLINNEVSESIIKQREEYAKLSESEKILAKVRADIEKQKAQEQEKLQEIQEEKKKLEEKKAIAQALLENRKFTIEKENGQLTAFYEDEKWRMVEINDFANAQYAQDLENKRLKLEQDLLQVEAAMLKEVEMAQALADKKKLMEQQHSEILKEEAEKRRKLLQNELNNTKKAIKVWNEYWKAKKEWGWNTSVDISTNQFKGFKEWWYTWNGGVDDVAGVVHGWEYVIPNNVLKQLAPSWVMWMIENMRKGFWWVAKAPQTQNVSNAGNTMNVTQNISRNVDILSTVNELSYLLRLNS